MIVPGQSVRIVVTTKPVDFRKGHDGPAAVVQNELGLDPHSGIIVVFRAKRGDRIKVLLWDGSGLVMIYKRLVVLKARVFDTTGRQLRLACGA